MPLTRSHSPQTRQGFPVAGGGLPVLGHLPFLYRDTLAVMRHAEQQCGSLFWLNFGFSLEGLVCLDPEVLTILKNSVTDSTFLYEKSPHFLGRSLLVSDGAAHRHLRSAVNAPFTPTGLSRELLGPVLAETVLAQVRTWVNRPPFRLLNETQTLALDLIFRLIGIESEALLPWRHAYQEYVLGALNIPLNLPGFPHWRANRARRWLDARLLELIIQTRQQPESGSLLSQLVHGRDDLGAPLSDAELIENLRFMIFAGHETSASLMAWMVFWLAHCPELWERLCAEVRSVGHVPRTPKELRRFPVAEALFRETLRLHPPIPNDMRRVTGALTLCGQTIPPGTDVVLSIVHLSRHPALFEAPDELRLERWLDRPQAPSPVELVPFGGGPHFCLGYHVAWLEAVQLLASLAIVVMERGASSQGKRPRLVGAFPSIRYLPTAHPSPSARIVLA